MRINLLFSEHTAVMVPSEILSQFIKGEVDLSKLAKLELSYGGQDASGRLVGFKDSSGGYLNIIQMLYKPALTQVLFCPG